MKFIISKTSEWDGQPHERAVKETFKRYDVRSFKSEEEHDERLRYPWRSEGTEHQMFEGGICRRLDDQELWTITFKDANDLLSFIEEVGRVVIEPSWHLRGPQEQLLEIEIYDSWRE